MRKALTAAAVERMKPPPRGQIEVFDRGYPGLLLRVSYGGGKAFAMFYRHGGKLAPDPRLAPGDDPGRGSEAGARPAASSLWGRIPASPVKTSDTFAAVVRSGSSATSATPSPRPSTR